MSRVLKELIDGLGLETRPGASIEMIRDRERELGVRFPPDYVELMLLTNGLEGFIEDRAYIRVHPIEEMMDDRLQRDAAEYWPGLIIFGDDGAREGFAFDTRAEEMPIVMFSWVGGPEDAVVQGRTIAEFLTRVPYYGDESAQA